MRLPRTLGWEWACFAYRRNVNKFCSLFTLQKTENKKKKVINPCNPSYQEVVSVSLLWIWVATRLAVTKRTAEDRKQAGAWTSLAHQGLPSLTCGNTEPTMWGSSGWPPGWWRPRGERGAGPQVTDLCSCRTARWAEWKNDPALTLCHVLLQQLYTDYLILSSNYET